jgi:ADP-heptose:LPS heptosyltransferase
MTLRQGAVAGVYRWKRRAWRGRLRRLRERARDPLAAPRVLVRMDAGIGNAVEATPLVQAVRTLWPRAHLTILPPPGDLFDGWCVVDRVARSPEELRGERFDAALLGWSVEAEGPWEAVETVRAQGLFPHWQLRPEREVDMDAARRLGYEGPTPPLYVSTRPRADLLPPHPLTIALAPGGKPLHRWRHKRWPYFGELASLLRARRPDARVCVVGTRDDECPEGVVDLRGRLSLAETAWALQGCALVVGNDCGPMHVADAVLAPALVLFGPTCEVKNGPRNRGVTLTSGAPCSPCQYDLDLLDSCRDPICMLRLSPERVAAEAERMLG